MVVVVGAGVTGLAVGLAVASRGRDVVVLESHPRVGQEASTHNSGVIHAGIYYPESSLKALLCVEGRDRLKSFCRSADLPWRDCGKFVVASESSEEAALNALAANARRCGVAVDVVGPPEVRRREPEIRAVRALWVPDSGWVAADAYVAALRRSLTEQGGHLLVATPVVGVSERHGTVAVTTPREVIEADMVVNAAGLWADRLSALCGGEAFAIHPCRGEYAQLTPSASSRVRGLVYPLPRQDGTSLGLHLARTIGGVTTIGPTARYQSSRDDYESDRLPVTAFLEAVRRLVPAVTQEDLRLGGTGIRAKLQPPGGPFADFLIRRDRIRPWLVHAAGIDSPGLTASLAVGRLVADLLEAGP